MFNQNLSPLHLQEQNKNNKERQSIYKLGEKKQINILLIIFSILLAGIVVAVIIFWFKTSNKIGFETKDYNIHISQEEEAGDSDNDGLLDSLETFYGTDPKNSDSDGDGYKDGDEVRNGYNPLGEGKLNETKKFTGSIDTQTGESAKDAPKIYSGTKDFLDITVDNFCITKEEKKLAELINNYRASLGLSKIPLSKSLFYVAKIHALDVVINKPVKGRCNPHSWSDKGRWSVCCYTGSRESSKCMNSKPNELTEYQGKGYENAVSWVEDSVKPRSATPELALKGWQISHKHHMVMINGGEWKNIKWNALGVSIYKGYAYAWFGEEIDPAGVPIQCSNCEEIKDKNLREECYIGGSITNNDLDSCSKIADKKIMEECIFRVKISKCDKFIISDRNQLKSCYSDLIKEEPKICEHLYNKVNERDDCYFNAAAFNHDSTICNKINSISKKDECYFYIAAQSKDRSVCDKISDSSKRKKCQSIIYAR
ncbi:hypothetical protein KAR28_02425 [Candidatus Parcubacteria bacterium]|nr:hypothetical protein [Candidatus Parcubacteria bacterium]